MHVVDIWISHNYCGGWAAVAFKKRFELPFVPHQPLYFLDGNSEQEELQIEFVTHDHCRTTIVYDSRDNTWTVDIQIKWPDTVSDETVDDTFNMFSKCGWENYKDKRTDIKEMSQRAYATKKR